MKFERSIGGVEFSHKLFSNRVYRIETDRSLLNDPSIISEIQNIESI